jgi:hypothetical protein
MLRLQLVLLHINAEEAVIGQHILSHAIETEIRRYTNKM